MKLPLCFVLMPFGIKKTSSGRSIDFDSVYGDLIVPAIKAADMEPLRADKEMVGGIIHKAMYERLLLCDYAVADLTTANANVFYELGVRHAVKPHSTILVYGKGTGSIPFDVAQLRAMPYFLDGDGIVTGKEENIQLIAKRLQSARNAITDSPVYQLIKDFPDIDRLKTDVFREHVNYSNDIKSRLFDARRSGVEAINEIEKRLGKIEDVEAGIVIDLFLSYRAVEAWDEMIKLASSMSSPLANNIMIREQLGFALNRAGEGEKAESILLDIINEHGDSSETNGILGRVYKDRYENAVSEGRSVQAEGFLKRAIDTYLAGFEADWRDAYPGINAITLMGLLEPPDERIADLLPVVRYALERRVAGVAADYWDHATLLELAVLSGDDIAAHVHLSNALAVIREIWEPKTTMRNLTMILKAKDGRDEDVEWIKSIITNLESGLEKVK